MTHPDRPVRHDHAEFLLEARKRPGFDEAHEALAHEYRLARSLLTGSVAANGRDEDEQGSAVTRRADI